MTDDMLRSFRFAPRLGFDGKPLAATSVRVKPGKPWTGPGHIKIKAPLGRPIIEMMSYDEVTPIVVDLYRSDIGKPGAMLVAYGVTPSQCAAQISPLIATSSGFLTITAVFTYERLRIVLDPTILDVVSSALV